MGKCAVRWRWEPQFVLMVIVGSLLVPSLHAGVAALGTWIYWEGYLVVKVTLALGIFTGARYVLTKARRSAGTFTK